MVEGMWKLESQGPIRGEGRQGLQAGDEVLRKQMVFAFFVSDPFARAQALKLHLGGDGAEKTLERRLRGLQGVFT